MSGGRPSKLTEKQWAEIGRRVASGEPMRALAREYGVGAARISERFSKRIPELKTLANSLATAEREVESLPVTEQVTVRWLADQLKSIGSSLARAANFGADTSARLHEMANKQAREIKGDESVALPKIMALTKTANEASVIGVSFMAQNKGKAEETPESNKEDLLREIASLLPD